MFSPVWPWVVSLALVVALAAGAWALWRRSARRTASPKPRPRLRHPVLLAHGMFGFTQLELGGVRREYFRGIPERLRAEGVEVHVAKLPPTGSIADRAEALAQAVRSIDAKRVNIIAHSMGGLDARYAIARLGLAARVASLTTVGTPHRGTPLADASTSIADKLWLLKLLKGVGLEVSGLYDLTTERMEAFNREIGDAKNVSYGSYVAKAAGSLGVHPLLLASHAFLAQRAGANDGVVPASSQRWGELLGELEADHWAQIGWSKGFDAPGLYLSLVRELRGRGV